MRRREEIAVTWHTGTAKDSTDYLPVDDLEENGIKTKCKHRVTKGNWHNWAWYDLEVTGSVAYLDYRPYGKENTKNGMELGVLRVTFTDENRTKIQRYEWGRSRTGSFKEISVTTVVPLAGSLVPYRPKLGRANREARSVKVRPGQVRFKRRLLMAYGGRCCVTGCDVSEALDGAHIDPYENSSHDHPKNGLLLRKDLHALFDAGLMAIDPKSRHIVFADRCQSDSDYAKIHRHAVIQLPCQGFDEYRPADAALRRRWRAFIKTQGVRAP